METMQVLLVVAVFALAGGVKGITGMGLPTVAMSVLGLWMPPAQAAALLVAPSLATNVAQCRGPHLRRLAARLWPGWLAMAVVTVFAPGMGGDASATDSASRSLGIVLVGYGLWGLWRPALPDLSEHGRWVGALAGMATGVVTSLTAVFVLPWVPYLQSLRFDKDEMVQALGLSFTVATLALAFRLQASASPGWMSASTIVATSGALGGAFLGLKLGEVFRGRLAGHAFQKALFAMFVLLGAANLMRAA
ncbi:sulfite exporter TauE/SafE family protein [Zeimonas arvi]|uniref:Probable membrane transporter protein n=1 Tax=Zeimonas arvi TaxID=2498847 RepID=A0A5C8NZZ1_9BURK|nr:sulfite exporter TauE/SafE family protein [Zeimonas arvi]TXL66919.1 sulfite exporter TauE/SafE family protein [Zeimonas arvi]